MALHAQRQSRTLSTRRTLLGLLLIPLVSLAGLWGFTASVTVGNVLSNQHYNSNVNATGASIIGLHATAQAESALTITWLSSGRRRGSCEHSSSQPAAPPTAPSRRSAYRRRRYARG